MVKDKKFWREYRKNRPWYRYLEYAKRRCTDPKHRSYDYYNRKGIQCLLTAAEVKELWDRDKAHLLEKPSLDRLDSTKHYQFDNCKFIEHIKNSGREHDRELNNICQQKTDGEWEE